MALLFQLASKGAETGFDWGVRASATRLTGVDGRDYTGLRLDWNMTSSDKHLTAFGYAKFMKNPNWDLLWINGGVLWKGFDIRLGMHDRRQRATEAWLGYGGNRTLQQGEIDLSRKMEFSEGFDVSLKMKGILGQHANERSQQLGYAGAGAALELRERVSSENELVFWQTFFGTWLYSQKSFGSRKEFESAVYSVELGATKKLSSEVSAGALARLGLDKLNPEFYFFAANAMTFFGQANVKYAPGENRFEITGSFSQKKLDKKLYEEIAAGKVAYSKGDFETSAFFKKSLETREYGVGVGYGDRWKLGLELTRREYSTIGIDPSWGAFLNFNINIGSISKAPERDEREQFDAGRVYSGPLVNRQLANPYDAVRNARDIYSLVLWTAMNYPYDLTLADDKNYPAYLLDSKTGVCHDFSEFQAWAANQMGYKAYRIDYWPNLFYPGHSIAMVENGRGEVFTSEYGKLQKIDVSPDASLQEKAKQAVAQGSYALGVNKNGNTLIRVYSPNQDPYKSWTYQHTPETSAFYYGKVESEKSASTISGVRALFPDVFGEFGRTEK